MPTASFSQWSRHPSEACPLNTRMTVNGKQPAVRTATRTAAKGGPACSLSQRERAGMRENGCEVSVAATGLKARYMTAWGGASSASEAPGSPDTTTPALKGRHSVTPFQGVRSTGPVTWASGALRALQPRLSYGRLSALSCQVVATLSVCMRANSHNSRANSSIT
jgi:hypothetical protein